MIEPANFEDMLARYLNGDLSADERREFADLITSNPAAQAAFDQALYDEALLQASHRPKPDAKALAQVLATRPQPVRATFSRMHKALAVAAMLAVGLGLWLFARQSSTESNSPVAAAPTSTAGPTAEPLRCVVFGMVEDGFDGAKFRFRSSLVFRRVAGEAPLSLLEGKTFDVHVPGDLAGQVDSVAVAHEDAVRKLKRGAYATLAIEMDAQGSIKLLKVPEAMGSHYPGQCACRQGIDLPPPARPQAGKTQG